LFSPESDLGAFKSRPVETAALFGGTAATAILVFSTHVPLAHLVYPFAIWAALRFYAQGAATLAVLVSSIAILQTAGHHGPFAMLSPTTNLVSLQAFNASVALTSMTLAALTLERRHAQVSLEGERETARRLKMLDEFKDSLLTAVSHELRTPLTVIIGLASTLRNPDLELSADDHRELLVRLEANAKRLDHLLMDLLDVDRLNRRIIEPNPRPTGLRETVLRVLEVLPLERHQVNVEIGDESASVDPAHLERIVENLVMNAAKHTPLGTRIWVRAFERSDGVTIAIEDEGPGVPDEIREAVFEPFRRGEANSHAPGTGIGLSLVARFAALNGGRAWVEERDGGGASFRVLLPAHRAG
jgi:two-component system sensor histidine kinase KdpD